jgi:hypothetical protein
VEADLPVGAALNDDRGALRDRRVDHERAREFSGTAEDVEAARRLGAEARIAGGQS